MYKGAEAIFMCVTRYLCSLFIDAYYSAPPVVEGGVAPVFVFPVCSHISQEVMWKGRWEGRFLTCTKRMKSFFFLRW